jgi:hypothetical protein
MAPHPGVMLDARCDIITALAFPGVKMRTTLDIEDDVLLAAKELAARQKKATGTVISELARRGLHAAQARTAASRKAFLGFRPLPRRGSVVTNELINKLRDQDAY